LICEAEAVVAVSVAGASEIVVADAALLGLRFRSGRAL
jgi:hypothetical protein